MQQDLQISRLPQQGRVHGCGHIAHKGWSPVTNDTRFIHCRVCWCAPNWHIVVASHSSRTPSVSVWSFYFDRFIYLGSPWSSRRTSHWTRPDTISDYIDYNCSCQSIELVQPIISACLSAWVQLVIVSWLKKRVKPLKKCVFICGSNTICWICFENRFIILIISITSCSPHVRKKKSNGKAEKS